MKKWIGMILTGLLIVTMEIGVLPQMNTVKAVDFSKTLYISPGYASVKVGKTINLKAYVGKKRAPKVSWEVQDKKIAVVSKNGVVKGKKAGNTYVYCTIESWSKTITSGILVSVCKSGRVFKDDTAKIMLRRGWNTVQENGMYSNKKYGSLTIVKTAATYSEGDISKASMKKLAKEMVSNISDESLQEAVGLANKITGKKINSYNQNGLIYSEFKFQSVFSGRVMEYAHMYLVPVNGSIYLITCDVYQNLASSKKVEIHALKDIVASIK